MKAIIDRKQTSFRLSTDLINRLRQAARKENRSLNNFVESTLVDIMYNEPNEETQAAIKEARSGENLKKVDTSSFENFIKSCSE